MLTSYIHCYEAHPFHFALYVHKYVFVYIYNIALSLSFQRKCASAKAFLCKIYAKITFSEIIKNVSYPTKYVIYFS